MEKRIGSSSFVEIIYQNSSMSFKMAIQVPDFGQIIQNANEPFANSVMICNSACIFIFTHHIE